MRVQLRKLGLVLFALTIIGSLVLATSVSASRDKRGAELRAAMITNQEAGDDATVDGMIQGLNRGKKALGYSEVKHVVVLDAAQYEPALRALAQQGYPLIIGAVQGLGPAFDAVAKDFPKTKFAIFFADVKRPNVASFFAPQQHMGFPSGVAAGLLTKTNKLGYIVGIEHPLVRDAEAGFIAGALAVNPKVKVYDSVPNTLTDPAVGKEVARTFFDKGVDVISSLAVHTSLGAYQYAGQLRKQGKLVWAASNDAQHIARYAGSAAVLSSVFLLQNAVFQSMKDFKQGKFTGGIHSMTLANGQVGISSWGPKVPASVKKKVLAWVAKVGKGYKVPDHTAIPKWIKKGVVVKG